MTRSLNKVMIIGNLGRDPELRYTPQGTPVASFSVATNRRWSGPEGEPREATDWFNIVCWRKLAEIANQYLSKGRKVYIEGRLQTRSWEDDQGQRHYRTEVVANDLIMLDSAAAVEAGAAEEDLEIDEIPF